MLLSGVCWGIDLGPSDAIALRFTPKHLLPRASNVIICFTGKGDSRGRDSELYIYLQTKDDSRDEKQSQSFLVNKTLMVNQALCSAFRESILVRNHSGLRNTSSQNAN